MSNKPTLADKFFRDKHGQLALAQKPNWPIITWAAAGILSIFIKHGLLHNLLSYVSFIALVYWAFLEIFLGINYFRRLLGALVLALSIYSRFIN